jgi:hypothetical protein
VNRFIVLSFLVMAWGYYELSGGADFVPETRPVIVADTEDAAPAPEDTTPDVVEVVTRADTESLDAIDAIAVIEEVATPTPDTIVIDPETVASAIPEPAEVPVSVEDALRDIVGTDMREVTGDLVNMRDGPGTDFGVIDKLARGSLVNVIETGIDGWVRVEVETTGQTGWMSDQFLVAVNG